MTGASPERAGRPPPRHGANDRMKRLWGPWLSGSIAAAALLHGALLALGPRFESPAPAGHSRVAARVVFLAPAGPADLPAAPEAIAAPALPTVDDLRLLFPADLSGPLPTVGELALERPIAPPVISPRDEWLDYESFAPILVAPYVRNRAEMKRFLERHYRPILEFSGAQGVVMVHFWVDERGGVARVEVAQSSGSRSLDRLAVRLGGVLRFSPALRLGRPVRVLVRLPIAFRQSVS